MEHAGLDAQRPQRPYATDTENHFLADAGGLVTAVEPVCDVAIRWGVLGTVGIEQVNGDAADLGFPEPGVHVATGDADDDLYPLAIGAASRLDREVARESLAIFGMLD